MPLRSSLCASRQALPVSPLPPSMARLAEGLRRQPRACSGERGASSRAWLLKGWGTAGACAGFGCQECVGVCSEVLAVAQFLFPHSTLRGLAWCCVGGGMLEASFGPEVSTATSRDRCGLLFFQPTVARRGSAIWLVKALY